MSALFNLLTSIRATYVEQFDKALQELRDKGHAVIVEPPMLDERGELAREGVLNLAGRYDFAVQDGESAGPSLFSPARMLSFDPVGFQGGGLEIVVAPFSWDAVRIAIDGETKAIAAALGEWFENAIGAPEGVDVDGLQYAAHFLSDPDVAGGTSVCQADLGTADIEILIDLFDRLRLAGATRVELSLPTG